MCAGFINKNVDSKLMNKNSYIKCACGCGKTLFKYDKKNRKHMFLSGHNAKINHPLKGKHLSEKVRKKISLSKKGIPNPKHSATLKRLFKINKIRIWNKNLTKKIDKRVRIKENKVDKVEVNTLAILFDINEIKIEIFSCKSKDIPSGSTLFTELLIESINDKESTLLTII